MLQCMEKRKLSYTVGGNVNWCSHYGKRYEESPKTKNKKKKLKKQKTKNSYHSPQSHS